MKNKKLVVTIMFAVVLISGLAVFAVACKNNKKPPDALTEVTNTPMPSPTKNAENVVTPTPDPTKAPTPTEMLPSTGPTAPVDVTVTPDLPLSPTVTITDPVEPDEPTLAPTEVPTPTVDPEITAAPSATATPKPTNTVRPVKPTNTPKPTSTPKPTKPTNTPKPTATPTPFPQYVVEIVPEMLGLVNDARDELGLRHLIKGDKELEEIALKRVFEFREEFRDSSKEIHEGTVNHWHNGYDSNIGEIAAYGDRRYELAFDTWKGSPNHWASIVADGTEDYVVPPGVVFVENGITYTEGDIMYGDDVYMVCVHLKYLEGTYYAHYWVIVFAGVQRTK